MPQRPATSLVRKRPALEGPRARPSSALARGTNDGNLRLWELYKRKGLTDGSLRKSALPPTPVSQPLVYERRWCSLSPKPKPAAAARRAKMRAETERVRARAAAVAKTVLEREVRKQAALKIADARRRSTAEEKRQFAEHWASVKRGVRAAAKAKAAFKKNSSGGLHLSKIATKVGASAATVLYGMRLVASAKVIQAAVRKRRAEHMLGVTMLQARFRSVLAKKVRTNLLARRSSAVNRWKHVEATVQAVAQTQADKAAEVPESVETLNMPEYRPATPTAQSKLWGGNYKIGDRLVHLEVIRPAGEPFLDVAIAYYTSRKVFKLRLGQKDWLVKGFGALASLSDEQLTALGEQICLDLQGMCAVRPTLTHARARMRDHDYALASHLRPIALCLQTLILTRRSRDACPCSATLATTSTTRS